MNQPCLDCGTVSDASRCPQHRAAAKARAAARHQGARLKRGGPRNRGGGGLPPAGGTCWICGKPATNLDPMQWDHVIPVREGGAHAGVLPAHRSCNIRRHHARVAAERKAAEKDDLDRRLMRGKYARLRPQGPEGEGLTDGPPSKAARRSSR